LTNFHGIRPPKSLLPGKELIKESLSANPKMPSALRHQIFDVSKMTNKTPHPLSKIRIAKIILLPSK
jgi:hypothetical protein